MPGHRSPFDRLRANGVLAGLPPPCSGPLAACPQSPVLRPASRPYRVMLIRPSSTLGDVNRNGAGGSSVAIRKAVPAGSGAAGV